MIAFRVEVPIYRVAVVFLLGDDRKRAVRWLKENNLYGKGLVSRRLLDTVFNDEHDGITCSNDKGHRIVVHFSDGGDTPRTIAHEILHVSSTILRWAGVGFNEESEEAYAYLVGYITGEVYHEIEKHGRDKTSGKRARSTKTGDEQAG